MPTRDELIDAVIAAARDVAESEDTDDGMCEVKWDEMVRLRDALYMLDGPKPCVPVACPPLEEVEINWTGPAHNYVPGSFAREVEEFYGGPIT